MKHIFPSSNAGARLRRSVRHPVAWLSLAILVGVTAIAPASDLVQRAAQPRLEPAIDPISASRSADEALRAGLEYLLKQQQADGGWNQGGGWRQSNDKHGGR